jgi:hypothetical protein
MPSPSWRTPGGEASIQPSLLVALLEAARSWDGQQFVLTKAKLSHTTLRMVQSNSHIFARDN